MMKFFLSSLFWLPFLLPGSVPDSFSPSRCGSAPDQKMRIRPDPDPQHCLQVRGTYLLIYITSSRFVSDVIGGNMTKHR